MRSFWTAALCGLMFCAPAMAQESDDAPTVAQEVESAPTMAQHADGPGEQGGDDVKPDAGSSLDTVGPVSGYTYFHRAGATLADQRADLAACRPTILAMTYAWPPAQGVSSSGSSGGAPVYVPPTTAPMSTGAAIGAGVGVLVVVAAMEGAAQRAAELRGMQLNYENCMLVRGWSVMVLDDEFGRNLDRLSEARLDRELETLVGAPTPTGAMGRRFDNSHQFRPVDNVEEVSLSLRALPDNYFRRETARGNSMLQAANRREERERALRARERAEREAERQRILEAAYHGRPERAESVDLISLSALPEGSALILVDTAGPTPRFVRTNTQAGDGVDVVSHDLVDSLSAYVVPAGEWRLVSLSTGAAATTHCLGAPTLRVGAGDVVFAGAFGPSGVADLSLDAARSHLQAHSHLAERLQAASYVNGSTFECGDAAFATAYEIADAPFVEGYVGGSRAAGASQ